MKDHMTRLVDYLKSKENIELRVLFYFLDSPNGKKKVLEKTDVLVACINVKVSQACESYLYIP